MERLLTIDEVAQMLSLSVGKVRRLIYDKQFPYVKIACSYRFRLSEINAWIEKEQTDGKNATRG